MNKTILGLAGGVVAGLLDATPMVLMRLSWDATLSAFVFWVVCGILISRTEFNLPSPLQGIATSLLALLPVAVLVAFKEPASLVPMSFMTVLLGGALGYTIRRWGKN